MKLFVVLAAFAFAAQARYRAHPMSKFTPEFGDRIKQGVIEDKDVAEASGIVVSRVHPNVMYTHNDKGGKNKIYAVDIATGETLADFKVKKAENYDWEDLAYGPCYDDCKEQECSPEIQPSRYCIYIGETGDHNEDGAKNIIYAIREPSAEKLEDGGGKVDLVGKLKFSWKEKDAETLMIYPDGQLYIVSKVDDGKVRIGQIPTEGFYTDKRVKIDKDNTVAIDLETTKKAPQGGDINADGTGMLLIGDDDVFYFRIIDNDVLGSVSLQPNGHVIPNYKPEIHTEAVSWAPDGKGFYSVAEGNQPIYYYPIV